MNSPVSVGSFESFISETRQAKTADELFSVLRSNLENHGYDRVIFSIINDKDIAAEDCTHGVMYNYPEDWQKYYTENNLDRIGQPPLLSP